MKKETRGRKPFGEKAKVKKCIALDESILDFAKRESKRIYGKENVSRYLADLITSKMKGVKKAA